MYRLEGKKQVEEILNHSICDLEVKNKYTTYACEHLLLDCLEFMLAFDF